MFTFIHAADLHLDSPLRGLPGYDGAPGAEIRGATRRALVNLVELALAEGVSFVIIAGDLYDGDWRDYNTGLFFTSEMARLRAAGIPVFLVTGNHDAISNITKTLHLPENVHFLGRHKPETQLLESLGVALHGQSFATRDVPDNLAANYPTAHSGYLNIGILHTSAAGGFGHDPYAPCTLETLLAKGYDYWALGQIHAHQVVHESPWIVYSGNTQGRHVRETGAKGCTLVSVDDGQICAVEHRELDVLRWCILDISVADCADFTAIHDIVLQSLTDLVGKIDRFHAVRIVLSGACPAHDSLHADPERLVNEIRALANDVGNGQLWVEEVRVNTTSPQTRTAETNDAVNGLQGTLTAWMADDEKLAELSDDFKDLALKLPLELRNGMEPLDPLNAEVIRAALADVGDILQTGWNKQGGVA